MPSAHTVSFLQGLLCGVPAAGCVCSAGRVRQAPRPLHRSAVFEDNLQACRYVRGANICFSFLQCMFTTISTCTTRICCLLRGQATAAAATTSAYSSTSSIICTPPQGPRKSQARLLIFPLVHISSTCQHLSRLVFPSPRPFPSRALYRTHAGASSTHCCPPQDVPHRRGHVAPGQG